MRGVISLLVAAVVTTYTLQDIRNGECNVACRKEGYDTGYYIDKKKSCGCITVFEYRDITAKPFTLKMNQKKTSIEPELTVDDEW